MLLLVLLLKDTAELDARLVVLLELAEVDVMTGLRAYTAKAHFPPQVSVESPEQAIWHDEESF